MSAENKLAKKKRRSQNIAFGVFTFTSYAIVALLFVILAFIVIKGIGVISWEFISEMPKNGMTEGGIFPAIVGTLCLVLVSMVFAFPVGVLAAIYMNEYVKDGIVKKIIKQMTNNLAGVPSIVFGLFGMSLFVNKMGFGDSILAGGLTLGLLVLPIVIRTTEESLKAVDNTFRQASYGLGASKWETTSKIVFPIAFPNVITGLILSIGRVSGETAPILFTVAAYFLPKLPTSIFDQAMALPYHLYVISTSGTNIEASRAMAYGTALVLIIIVLISNLLANALRKYYGKKVKMN
ncbi:phosphate transport system permease protein [Flavobacterium sp. 7E]|uniref:phosphate ABC transporter permease PstA n=1 Tax=unclassified Flavobacterium TaxID=196869 RepID=UPI001570237B|nr:MULTISPECIES: phosphate ABC transporter permease PstA [unclassified Flavobacterium]MBE0391806.1 Phosphate transport system permease protein PstA 1 [Flavobacterium sp. PL002]NRS87154.1 phosphate transport system permease protein [Flavobacterium sp. 7E]NRT14118.1 phosphate transport system permease protein [Flavobacterium sp. 28A]